MRIGFGFDLRNPKQWYRPWPDMYAEHLDFISWMETLGFGAVWLAEHHGIDDGYLPSPLMIGSAIAARTRHLRISTGVSLAPHYHPVRLAEDCAVLDILSNGRLELAMGIGYLPFEATAYGFEAKRRGKLSNEVLHIARRLLDGETVDFDGEFYQLKNARITPLPIQKPHLPLFIGAVTPIGFKRAAQYDGYIGPVENWAAYVEAVREAGKPESAARIISMSESDMWFVVSHDPERTLEEIAPHAYYQLNTYAEWQKDTNWGVRRMDFETFKKAGWMKIFTPPQAIDYIRSRQQQAPLEAFCMQAPAGFPLSKYAPYVELFAKEVLPAFR